MRNLRWDRVDKRSRGIKSLVKQCTKAISSVRWSHLPKRRPTSLVLGSAWAMTAAAGEASVGK